MPARISADTLARLSTKYGSVINASDLYKEDPKAYAAANLGALIKIRRGVYSLNGAAVAEIPVPRAIEPTMTREEKSAVITERFDVLEMLSDSLIKGSIRSLTVSGAPGVGKSFTLEHKLAQAELHQKIRSVVSIKGSISPIGLYMSIWEQRKEGQVIILDDCDSIFQDEEAMNILKAALDTSAKRVISWMKDSKALADAGIDRQFEYKGQIVFLTNVNIEAVVEKQGKMAPHMGALLSRSVFLDLAIHSCDDIMIRIEQVMAASSMRQDLKLSVADAERIMDWMRTNVGKLRSVSLRTVIQLAAFMKSTSDWQKVARTTLLKQRF